MVGFFIATVVLSLRAAGNAPQLKHKRFAVERDKSVAWVIQWLCQRLKVEEGETVVSVSRDLRSRSRDFLQFVYVQQTFAPPLDIDLDTLYKVSKSVKPHP